MHARKELAAITHASSAVFASIDLEPKSRSATNRRSPTIRLVISCTVASTPPIPDGGGLVGYRTVGDGEVCLFNEAVAIDLQEYVVVPCRRAPLERRIDERLENGPDLLPALAEGLAQSPRVLRALASKANSLNWDSWGSRRCRL